MITFVDTSILLDVFLPDPKFGPSSVEKLETAFESGSLIINWIVYTELVPQFEDRDLLDQSLAQLGVQIHPLDSDTVYQAGNHWKGYRESGGKRSRVMVDFLIAAHALIHADCLLTRDSKPV